MSINQIGFSETHSFHLQDTTSNYTLMEDDSNPYSPICRQPFYASRVAALPFLPTNYHPPSTWLAPATCQLPLFDLNQGGESGPSKEHLFEKPLTPSDVGKLNRLVIPKQHAERFFPLAGEAVEKGLLLSFEDECGKCWKFRYSYWNSSQSYVLTKGWSRYVKEKQLDAGDVVLFQRHRLDGERLFIGWRRKVDGERNNTVSDSQPNHHVKKSKISPSTHKHAEADYHHAGNSAQESIMALPRKVRLFGVNLEYQVGDQSSEPSTPDATSISSHGLAHQYYNSHPAYSSNHMVGYNY